MTETPATEVIETGGTLTPDEVRMLESALSVMSPKDQVAIVGFYYYGLSLSTLARGAKCRKDAYHMRIQRALRRTRRKLGVHIERG